jgi:hydroxyacylglutathione hydrolase
MKLIIIESGPAHTNGYLIWDELSQEGAIIDTPLQSCDEFVQIIKDNNINLKAILITHTHWDHTGDAACLKRVTGASVYVHKDDEYRLIDPNGNKVYHLPFKLQPCSPDGYLTDGQIIQIGNINIQVIHTPGHTEGGVCFAIDVNKIIFTGDNLFLESIGRTDLPEGNTQVLLNSIKTRIMILPDDFRVYPGHGPSTTIKYEKKHNQFLNQ